MSQLQVAYVHGLILGLLTVWGLVWLTSDRKERPPTCHFCGRRCEPVRSLPMDKDGRVTSPANARWYCKGTAQPFQHHVPIYYAEPKPEGPREL